MNLEEFLRDFSLRKLAPADLRKDAGASTSPLRLQCSLRLDRSRRISSKGPPQW
jgi:hypothetical protein